MSPGIADTEQDFDVAAMVSAATDENFILGPKLPADPEGDFEHVLSDTGEAISYASDALDKIRYESIDDPDKIVAEPGSLIRICPAKATSTIATEVSGIGMSKNVFLNAWNGCYFYTLSPQIWTRSLPATCRPSWTHRQIRRAISSTG